MQVYEVIRKEIGYDVIIKDNKETWLKLVGDGSAFDKQGNGFIEYNTPVDCSDLDGKWIFHGWIEGRYEDGVLILKEAECTLLDEMEVNHERN